MRELFEMSFEVVKASLPMFFSGLKLTLLYSFFGNRGFNRRRFGMQPGEVF